MHDRSALLLRTATGALDLVRRHRTVLDSLNVFPVADSDTGTNICLTLAAAVEAACTEAGVPLPDGTAGDPQAAGGTLPDGPPADPPADPTRGRTAAAPVPSGPGRAPAVAAALATGALLGARGNSGVILGQYVGELAERLATPPAAPTAGPGRADPGTVGPGTAGRGTAGRGTAGPGTVGPADAAGTGGGATVDVTGSEVADALAAAAHAARRAVARPVEGTVLTVADDAARTALVAAADGAGPAPTVRAAVDEARRAVARTTTQLEALEGVQDAGGWGLVLLLEALAAALGDARDVVGPDARGADAARAGDPDDPAASAGTPGHDEHGHAHAHTASDGEFELMAVARTHDAAAVDGLRADLVRLGQSVAVVGRSGLWQVHVHSGHVVDVVGALRDRDLGVREVVVRHLLAHHEHPVAGVVMVTRAPGLVTELARSSAVVVVVEDGPADDAVVRAVEDTAGDDVLVLADGLQPLPGGLPAGVRVRLRDGLDVGHLVAAAAALVLAGPGAPDALDRVDRAVDAVRTATVDVRVAPGGTASRGGGVGPAVHDEHDEVVDVARALLAAGEPAEVLTVVTSRGTPEAAVRALREELGEAVELVVVEGGTPGAGLVLAAEPAP